MRDAAKPGTRSRLPLDAVERAFRRFDDDLSGGSLTAATLEEIRESLVHARGFSNTEHARRIDALLRVVAELEAKQRRDIKRAVSSAEKGA